MGRWLSAIPAVATLTMIGCATPLTALGQIVPDNTLGSENSVVTPNVDIRGINSDRIDGGAVRGGNLFHSFQEFNVDVGRGVYFSNPDSIVNILTRVTGDNVSNILGTLGVLGNANLFLINPNGIVFGPNARLDVGGSFFASTADGILFENGVEFAASNPEAPPLLTINIPLGLNIRENPGTIVNQSIAVDSEDNVVGLQVQPRRTLGLVGGDIQLEGGILTAPQGRIELGSVAGNSQVSLTPIDKGYAISYEGVQNFRDIALSQASIVDVRGEGGGDVQIQGRRVTLTEESVIGANTQGAESGGILSIQASESVEVIGSRIFANVESGAIGSGGNLIITTQNLLVQDGAFISASTFGNGNGGNFTITATDIKLIGVNSGLLALVQPEASGQGGNIIINTQNLLVQDGSILASTFGSGNAGNLRINATDIELIGTFSDNRTVFTEISTATQVTSDRNGGDLTIDTQRLVLRDGSQISTGTSSVGNSGNLTIKADSIEVIGRSIDGLPSAIAASAEQLPNTPTVTGNGGTLTIDTRLLSVQEGGLIFVGTGSDGDAGNLTIRASEVEVNGVSRDGQAPSSVSASTRSGSTGNGGTLTIDTQSLRIQNGAQVDAGTFGNGNGGNLLIRANAVEVTGIDPVDGSGGSSLSARTQGAGAAGDLTIEAQTLVVADGAQVDAATFDRGDGGDINITATDIRLSNGSVLGTGVQPGAAGNGGNVTINTQRLDILDGAEISSGTFGSGDSGNLAITATDIQLVGDNSGLFTLVRLGATGNGGTITINTQRLQIQEQAEITASTVGNADAGDITITANAIELIDTGSIIFTTVEPEAIGNAGNLMIDTQYLSVRDGAQIGANTSGNGDGGDLTITANDIELIGTSANGIFSSIVGASVQPGAVGTGGDLTIDTQGLLIKDGAGVSTATFANGDAGDITITANDIELIGTPDVTQTPSFIEAGVAFTSVGRGGTITLNAENVSLQDGATINVRSEGTKRAGDLTINAPTILLDNQASLNAETTAGEGNIILNTSDFRLRRNSRITTNATGEATGGNITINTETLTALEDSDISANAEDAFGGQVKINADAIFGTQFRPQQSNASDITATSELGPDFSGTVEINNETDPARGLIDLPQTVVDPNDLIAQEFCRQRGTSQFTITGRGGLVSSPNDIFTGDRTQVPLVEPVEPVRSRPNRLTSTQPSRTEPNQPRSSADIIPARGWIRDENGDVILVSYDPTKTGVRRQPVQPPQCQP